MRNSCALSIKPKVKVKVNPQVELEGFSYFANRNSQALSMTGKFKKQQINRKIIDS